MVYSVVMLVWRFRHSIKQYRKSQQTGSSGYDDYSGSRSYGGTDNVTQSSTSTRKKIIPKDEGEYVDFEEVD